MNRIPDVLRNLPDDVLYWFERLFGWISENPGLLAITGVMALAPAIFWLTIYMRRTEMTVRKKQIMRRTFIVGCLSVVPVMWVNYILSNFFGYNANYFISSSVEAGAIHYVFLAFVLVAVNEEYAKFLIVRRFDKHRREFNRIADSIQLAASAALGFAFIENITYFVLAINLYEGFGPELVQVVIFRSMGSMLAHTMFSSFYGYYYGRARFSGMDEKYLPWWRKTTLKAQIQQGEHLTDVLLPWSKKVRLAKSFSGRVKESELILGGLLVAVVLHAIYNSFLEYDLVPVTVPLIAGGFMTILYQLNVSKNLDTHIFSVGGKTVVSSISEEGELRVEDPLVIQMLQRWDENGASIAQHSHERYERNQKKQVFVRTETPTLASAQLAVSAV